MKDDQAFRLEQAQNVGLGFELKAQLVSMQEVEVVEVKDYPLRGSMLNPLIKPDPLLKSFHGDPRYAAFLKKMRLPL